MFQLWRKLDTLAICGDGFMLIYETWEKYFLIIICESLKLPTMFHFLFKESILKNWNRQCSKAIQIYFPKWTQQHTKSNKHASQLSFLYWWKTFSHCLENWSFFHAPADDHTSIIYSTRKNHLSFCSLIRTSSAPAWIPLCQLGTIWR